MKSRYFLQLAGLSSLWGATFLLTRIATPVLGPSVSAASRLVLATATLAMLMHLNRVRWPREHWRELLALGAIGIALPHLLSAWASLYLPAGYSAVLGATSMLFATLASALLKEDELTWAKASGCLLAFTGVSLLVRWGPVDVTSAVIAAAGGAVAGCFFSGLSAPLLKRATKRMPPLAIAGGVHLGGLLFLLPGAIWGYSDARFSFSAVGAVVVMGVVTSGLAYWQYMRIVNRVSAVAAHSSTLMVTISGVIWGHLVLGEVFTPAAYAGALLVLVATLLVTSFNPLRTWLVSDPAIPVQNQRLEK